MKHIIVMKSVLIFTLLSVISCSKTPQEQIIGSWHEPKDGMTMVFAENGSATMKGPGGSAAVNWSIPEEGKIIVSNPDDASQSEDGAYKFIGEDTLELTIGSDKKLLTRLDDASKQANSTGIIGTYGGSKCVYQNMEFNEGGKLYISMSGIQIPATYEVDGNRVSVIAGGEGIVFTKNGNSLDGGIAGVCTKL